MTQNQFLNVDCFEFMKQLTDNSVDAIITDPPYGYLNVNFDKEYFDEEVFFKEIKRILKPDGLICFTGRGDSFYRWNVILDKLGFPQKEELVWNKVGGGAAFNNVKRIHEMISVRGNKPVNRVRIQPEEYFEDSKNLLGNVQKIISLAKNEPEEFIRLAKGGIKNFNVERKAKYDICAKLTTNTAKRSHNTLTSFVDGFTLKSIIRVSRDNVHENIHPTQKPVALFEKLVLLCTKEGDLVFDPFAGSGTTMLACQNTNRRCICCEKDKEFWEKAVERINDSHRASVNFI